MSTSNRTFSRSYCNILNRAYTMPSTTGWYLARDDALVPVTYQLLGACLVVLWRRFESHDACRSLHLITQLPSCMSFAICEYACHAHNMIHFSIDPRLDHTATSEFVDRLLPNQPMYDARRLRQLIADENSDNNIPTTLKRDELYQAGLACDLELLHQAKLLLAAEPDAVRTFANNHLSQHELSSAKMLYDKAHVDLDSPAVVLHSSGTTSQPKAILLSHRNLITNAIGKLQAMPQFENDCRLNVLPFAHAYARTCELGTWAIAGGAMCCVSGMEQAQAVGVQLKPTLLNGVPAIFHRLQRSTSNLDQFNKNSLLGGSLRMIASGGAGLDDETFNAYQSIDLPIHQGYGLTETSPVVCSSRFGEVYRNSVGPAITGVELRTDENQQLWVRGSNVMLGYYQDSESTQQRVVDGWLATGDLAIQLPNGHWRILGRVDDRITLANGYKVDPAELESQLFQLTKQPRIVACFAQQQLIVLSFLDEFRSDIEVASFQLNAATKSLPSPVRPNVVRVILWDPTLAMQLLNAKGQWIRGRVVEFAESLMG